ncbi:transglycosylase SLT domain-containing protein [Cyanobacterium stanieri LEGE 03274]|uniref:Transglycosylase SLT domain-containing protein n=1 Tax=Cyanobacterium stanieri LEGE 03274 TaxID=1828756 RepID=A0ABR9V3M7_9CHRO|nr:transglycosylase SLT domain-containing protein [Cyanobacterium stanieri]MBE9221736.1 transglycosylase SLT domain-containing protein [Cyanobacterium stanieri LEGE 03274]
MKKSKKLILPISTILLFIVGIIGATILTPQLGNLWDNVIAPRLEERPEYRLDAPSEVLKLADVSFEERKAPLEEIANGSDATLDRARARYLLANDLIREEFDGGQAWNYLQNLERQYPTLAPYIVLRQGRALELTNDNLGAKQRWESLINDYPQSPVIVEAYYLLGQEEPDYWQRAIAQFPQHPRTKDIIYELLAQNPNQKELLLTISEYDLTPRSDSFRDKLITDYQEELEPAQWQIIADSYWARGQFRKSADAYIKAPSTPENLYRIARGYQVGDEQTLAIEAYQKLIQEYPNESQTGLGLRRLASLVSGDEAMEYLDRVVENFPNDAPQALNQKFGLLSSENRSDEASVVRNQIISRYPQSDEAADFRWQIAQDFAQNNDLVSAWQWAQEIGINNPEASITPRASFWVGKWAQRLGQTEEAQEAFEFVLENHPHSYYAWRSAYNLGRGVGDFTDVRDLTFEVQTPAMRPIPPGGSTMFKELYLLGEDQDAIALFEAELSNPDNVSVTEQFTQGLLKQLDGQYLQSISLIWSLSTRENPDDLRQWRILRRSPEYWYALFPMPYQDLIVKWSSQRNLNPFLVTALMRQESRFQPLIQSPVGATGLMQVMPETGEWIAPQIELEEYSLTDPDDNINLGTWYLDYTHRNYDNNSLLAIASYNAGPSNVDSWIERFDLSDFDQFVEDIPFPETKGYVETVFGNYWNYVNLYQPDGETSGFINFGS